MTGARAALAALARGELAGWAGIPEGATFPDADAAFGDPGPGPNGMATMIGQPVIFRRYPPAAGIAAAGLVAYAEPPRDQELAVLRIPAPRLAADQLAGLGEPELMLPSGLAAAHRQHAWPSRGLVLHRYIGEASEVLELAVFRPTGPEAYQESWLARLTVERRRRW